MRKFLGIMIICLLSNWVSAQQKPDSITVVAGVEVGNDTLPHQDIPTVNVFPKKKFKSKRYERYYWRLVYRVKKVYPYAKRANELLKEYEEQYYATNDKKLRKKYIKMAEKELFDEYGPQLKKLSISEGRILIKLIDRETGHTSYELIQDLKGNLAAFFWQGIAKIFGNDLKSKFDPYDEDRLIEEIVFLIEAGVIK